MSVKTEEKKAIAHILVEEVYNNHNLDALDDILDPGYVNHTANIRGRERMKQLYATLLEEHPATFVNIDDIIAEGDKVAVRWTWYNDEVAVSTGITIHKIENGKIIEDWYSTKKVE